MAIGVYIIFFPNAKFYIGSSHDIAKRIQTHRNNMLKNKHENELLQREWDQYRAFDLYEYHTKDRENAYKLEQSFIDIHMKNLLMLNIAAQAKGGYRMRRHPDRKKIVDKIMIKNVTANTYMGKGQPFEKTRRRRRRRRRKGKRK